MHLLCAFPSLRWTNAHVLWKTHDNLIDTKPSIGTYDRLRSSVHANIFVDVIYIIMTIVTEAMDEDQVYVFRKCHCIMTFRGCNRQTFLLCGWPRRRCSSVFNEQELEYVYNCRPPYNVPCTCTR